MTAPSNANTSGLSVERRAELYDHMKLVAEANGFKSLTEAIARATSADRLAKALETLLSYDEQDAGCVPTDAHLDAQNDARAALQQETQL